jgi:PAS domain S-box-containing protein
MTRPHRPLAAPQAREVEATPPDSASAMARAPLSSLELGEEIFRDVFESSGDVYYVASADHGQLFFVSRTYETVWGRTRESAYGSRNAWVEAVHPEDRSRVEDGLGKLARYGQSSHEYRILRPDGSVRWIRSRTEALPPSSRFHGCMAGIARDITEQKQAEEQLRQQAARDAALVAFSRQCLAREGSADSVWSDALRYLLPAMQGDGAEVLGRDVAGGVVRHAHAGVAPAQGPSAVSAFVAFAATCRDPVVCQDLGADARFSWRADGWSALGMRSGLALVLRGRDSSPVATLCVYSAHVGHFHGPLVAFAKMAASVMVAVWENMRDRQALRESEQMLRQLTEHIDEVFYVADHAMTQILYISPAYEHVWGRTVQSLYAAPTSWIESIHPGDREAAGEAVAGLLAGGDFDVTFRIQRPCGEVRWVRDRAFVIRDASGRPYRMVGVARDLTAQRQAEENRLRLVMAETRAQARDEALSTVAHDLRNPLSALQVQIERLARATPEPNLERRSQAMLRATERMSDLLDELVEAARLQGSDIHLDSEAIDLDALLEDACQAFPAECEQHRFSLVHPPAPLRVEADRKRLTRVFVNLIGNAIKYSHNDAPIAIRAAPAHGGVEVSITDRGAGIAPEHLPYVFERFWQPPGGRARSGLGLGLYIVKRIIEAHRGRVWIDSAPEQGTCVHVLLPSLTPCEPVSIHDAPGALHTS